MSIHPPLKAHLDTDVVVDVRQENIRLLPAATKKKENEKRIAHYIFEAGRSEASQ